MFVLLVSITLACAALLADLEGLLAVARRATPTSASADGQLDFLAARESFWMRRMYDRFRSPYVGIWLFWRPGLIVNCPNIAKNVLVKDAAVFRDRFLSSGKSDPIGALNLFTVKGMFADYTTDNTGCAAFGLASDATLGGRSSIRSVTRDFMTYSALRGICWSSIFFCPQIVDIFRFSFFPESATKYFKEIFRTVVKKRGGYDRIIDEPKDLLDALLKIRQESLNDKEEICEDILVAQAAIFVEGGFDTSAGAMTYTIYELAFHPEIQRKVYVELLDAKYRHGIEGHDANVFNGLNYFNCVIKEALRKYSSRGWLDRIASQDYKIDDNLTIPAGTPVYVNAIGMHYDPDCYPHPNKFDLDRFLPENQTNIKPFTYMPFGDGPRSCIGKRFGLQTVRYGLAYILLHYEVQPLPNAPKPSEAKIDKRGMFLMPGEPLYVKYIPRE